MFESAFAAVNQNKHPDFKNMTWRKAHYDWCLTHSFGYCRLIVWHSADDNNFITEGLYKLKNGACADSFSTPYFYRMIETPWASLEESYYKCFLTNSDALINAVGVSLGNAGILYSFTIIIVIFTSMGISTLFWPDWRYQNHNAALKETTAEVSKTVKPKNVELAELATKNPVSGNSVNKNAAASPSSPMSRVDNFSKRVSYGAKLRKANDSDDECDLDQNDEAL